VARAVSLWRNLVKDFYRTFDVIELLNEFSVVGGDAPAIRFGFRAKHFSKLPDQAASAAKRIQ
jgi:hypothetical protein